MPISHPCNSVRSKTSLFSAWPLIIAVQLFGCGATLDGGDEQPPAKATYPLAVWALDITGQPVSEALVTVGEQSGKTDAQGWAHLLVQGSSRIIGRIEKAGYVKGVVLANLGHGLDNWTQSTLLPQGAPQTLKAELGGVIKRNGRELLYPPNALVDSHGTPVAGDFQVFATEYAVEDTPRGLAPVWPLMGDPIPPVIGIVAESGAARPLESYGMIDVTMSQNGEPLQVAPGKQVRLRSVLRQEVADRFTVDAKDSSIPSWFFDPSTAMWKQDGTGTVRQDELGRKVVEAYMTHFTTWNHDAPWPAEQDDCVVVTVVNASDGKPLNGVGITASGGAWAYSTSLATDASGTLCLDMKAGGTLVVSAVLPGYHLVAQRATSGSGKPGTICVPEQYPFCAHITLELCMDGGTCSGCPIGTTNCKGMCMDTQKDPKNCGACGNDCSVALSGASVCVAGACECAPSLTRCTSGTSFSCVDLQNNTYNCGGCGTDCTSTLPGSACMAGICKCASPLISCPVMGASQCVDPTMDAHCGGCTPCALGSTCVSGTCKAIWSSTTVTGINLRAAHCAGPEDCWAVGDNRAVYIYRAMTKAFESQLLPMTMSADLFSVWMNNKADVWMGSSSGGLLHYYDPGMGKGLYYYDVDSTAKGTVYGLHGWRGDHLYGVTDLGEVVQYNGMTWKVLTKVGIPLYAVWAVQAMIEDEVFAVGSGNLVLHKADGAMTFEKLSAAGKSGTVVLRAIRGFDAKNLIVAGDAGSILTSTDGGKTWNDITVLDAMNKPITAGYTGLWTYGSHAFLVSDAGHLLHSQDRGLTWRLESSQSQALNAVSGADLSMVIAVGKEIIRRR